MTPDSNISGTEEARTLTTISAEYLRSILDYDPETGIFTWRERADRAANWNAKHAGTAAGTTNTRGYRTIKIDGVLYRAHRLAWLYTTGNCPPDIIDHVNGDKLNNRISNLRPASWSENARNSAIPKNNTSGFKGVSFYKRDRKWKAHIRVDGQKRYLGLFATPDEAHAAYIAAAKQEFGEFARVS